MVWAVSLLTMKLIPHRLTGRVFTGYSEFDSIWYRSPSPHRISALPPSYNIYRCASTHFGENQLAPGSIGISPLTTAHPPIFQHRSVRTSTWCYPSFILAMVRSPGFGSANTDYRPFQTRFRFDFDIPVLICQCLQVAGSFFNRHAVTRSIVLPLLVGSWFHVLFHSPPGVLFTVPSRYCFAIGHTGVFSLTRWSSRIHPEFHVLQATRDSASILKLSTTGLSPPLVQLSTASSSR